MLRAYIGIKSAKVILAFLLLGSISGFVLGQELHQPFTPTMHSASVVRVSATGSLGAASVATLHNVTSAVHTAPPAHNPPAAMPSHHKHRHGKDSKGKDGISFSNNLLGTISVHQGNGDQGNSGGDTGGGD